MPRSIPGVVADVLNEPDVRAARTLLAEALLASTGTEMATRVSVRRGRPDAVLRIHGHGFRPPAELLPSAAQIREHPLYRYRVHTGDARPTRLEDVIAAGWPLHEEARRILVELRISVHQIAAAMPSAGEYDGWSLIAPDPISRLQLRPLVEHAALVQGLDRHVELLARIVERAGTQQDAGAPALTPRELAVLHLVHRGGTAASIGARLGVSPRTVQKHQEHLYRKLGARDRLGAVLAAQRAGLLPAPPAGEEAAPAREPGRIGA
ncbi:LuxR C-terminal-related transcriptional regulator [Agrococcus sp. HG114]|uniref:helix-turn-helix transcriptional regulator n=1 Tax=Agrococcus sp. HG114 TaxID=2969757 RepID=UPI00215B66C7|nr:LuxR C-terminal-related transcriptional regulator [Agrococcus sp. HG114]MCR8671080.1 LuxR C-terminal-related transcriptional regulator [Agrococcus sp. HG114]